MNNNISSEIGRTFYTTPRDGYKEGNIWIKRKEEEKLNSLLDNLSISICVDGPTGTGKSSLAITILKQRKIDFILVQVTQNMTWKDFCKLLLNAKVNSNTAVNHISESSIEKNIPLFKTHFGFRSNENSRDNFEYEEKVIAQMTDHVICDILYKKKITLLIDDFERANTEILTNVGEMCKLLTESFVSMKTRLVIVGTDDIYYRLTKFNKSLEGRLKELSLGTIDTKNESWQFLNKGFDKLKLKHPEAELKLRIGSTKVEDIRICKEACYDAADGLLKSLNELGGDIARQATVNGRISKATILEVSKEYLERNIKKFTRDYPRIFKCIGQDAVVKDIIIYLYKRGIGKIHSWDEIVTSLSSSLEAMQIENAICQLVEIDFLTRTGYNGEILFVTNPTLAHTISSVINNPTKYSVPNSFVFRNNQYVLPFLIRDDANEET
jgi:hypothetical protein